MCDFDVKRVEEVARAYALLNAIEHGGKAVVGAVMGKVMAELPELRPYARQVVQVVRRVVEEVNSMRADEQRRLLEERYSWVLEKRRKHVVEKRLPPLPGAVEGKVVTRFAPNPDFAMHLGNARPAILSYEYARMYRGKMILRFEDTDPRIKSPAPDAYEIIREDLRWLGIEWDEEFVQSLRMEVYYEVARKLLEVGGAYVDDRPGDEFKKYRDESALERYPPRTRPVEENLELWDRMLEGYFDEGEAVLRVKTDPEHPDPSVRDWVAFRVIDTSKYPHPLVGDRYIVWPTYNFAAAVDDHLMGVTHILRAREHMQNTIKQEFLYEHLGWKYPHVIHFGRLRLEGLVMSKSKMREIMERGGVEGVDDPRFATIAGLRRRGIAAETIRRIILEVGVKHTDASISYDNVAALNRSIIDRDSPRIMFVANPVKLVVEDLPGRLKLEIPFHPANDKLGKRVVVVEGPKEVLLISKSDLELIKKSKIVRLMEAFNIEVVEAKEDSVKAVFHSMNVEEARKAGAPIIQWVKPTNSVKVVVVKPEGARLVKVKGVAEESLAQMEVGKVVQFVRYGFVRIDGVSRGESRRGLVKVVFAHD